MTLPWEGTFLPTTAEEGYEQRELDFAQAVAGEGGVAVVAAPPAVQLVGEVVDRLLRVRVLTGRKGRAFRQQRLVSGIGQ